MSFNRGGKRRTIQSSCGWRCVGHPTEVDKKYIIHKRHCKECGEQSLQLPEFNGAGGRVNGWNGLKGHSKVNQMLSTTFVDGLRRDILVENVNTIPKATDKAVDILLTEAAPAIPLSASKKKRMKQKAKKGEI